MVTALLLLIGLGLVGGGGYLLTQGLWTIGPILVGLGVNVLIITAMMRVFIRLYHRASANRAFVRTGAGGVKVIKDSGKLVVPVLHQVIPVSLETLRLTAECSAERALTTRDNQQVGLSADVYARVPANDEDILQAARSLGTRTLEHGAVNELLQAKIIAALRQVVGSTNLQELISDREEFVDRVQQIVSRDLATNGLSLESMTISSPDRTGTSPALRGDVHAVFA